MGRNYLTSNSYTRYKIMDKTLKEIKNLRTEVKTLLDAVKAEDRGPNAEEVKQLTSLNDQIKVLEEKAAVDSISANNTEALAHLMTPVTMKANSFQAEIKDFLKEAADNSNRKSHVDLRTSITTKNLTSEFATTNGSYNARIANANSGFGNVSITPRVLDFFNIVPTSAGSVRVASLTSITNNAAAHAASGTVAGTPSKGETDFTWIGKDQVVATVAHFVKASRDILADSNRLEAFIGQKLLQGAMRKATNYIFNGDDSNVGQFDGFDNYSVQTESTSGVSNINRLALGIAKLANAPDGNEYTANAIFMNPADWATMQTSQSTSGYLLGSPGSNLNSTIWGVPVVMSGAVPSGYAYVGDFSQWDVYQREEMDIYVTDSDSDDFKKNIITILGEVRMTLGTMYPSSVCKVTLS